VDTELVRAALGQVKEFFGALRPYEQRELMQLVLQRAEVNEREITLEGFALNEASLPEKVGAEGGVVRMRPVWLPGRGAIRRYSCLSHSRCSRSSPEPIGCLGRDEARAPSCLCQLNNEVRVHSGGAQRSNVLSKRVGQEAGGMPRCGRLK